MNVKELYVHVKELHDRTSARQLTVAECMEVAKLRKSLLSLSHSPKYGTEAAIMHQLIREYNGGMQFSPLDLLELNPSPITAKELLGLRTALGSLSSKLGHRGRSYSSMMDALLPMDTPDDVTRALTYLLAFTTAATGNHILPEFPLPNN